MPRFRFGVLPFLRRREFLICNDSERIHWPDPFTWRRERPSPWHPICLPPPRSGRKFRTDWHLGSRFALPLDTLRRPIRNRRRGLNCIGRGDGCHAVGTLGGFTGLKPVPHRFTGWRPVPHHHGTGANRTGERPLWVAFGFKIDPPAGYGAMESSIVTCVPRAGGQVIWIWPPWASTMDRQMASPRPALRLEGSPVAVRAASPR